MKGIQREDGESADLDTQSQSKLMTNQITMCTFAVWCVATGVK